MIDLSQQIARDEQMIAQTLAVIKAVEQAQQAQRQTL